MHFSWFKINCQNNVFLSVHCCSLGTVFSFVLWTVWLQRNAKLYLQEDFATNKIVYLVKERAVEFFASGPIPVSNNSSSVQLLIGWTKPLMGLCKLNTDGFAMGNPGLAFVGGLTRDHPGNWIRGFARNNGRASSQAVENWGIRDGSQMVRNLNIQKLIVEMDS